MAFSKFNLKVEHPKLKNPMSLIIDDFGIMTEPPYVFLEEFIGLS